MRNFDRGSSRFGGGRDFKRRDFARRDSSDRFSMHRATCSKCGNECEVPFRPTGEKPVYCDKCFENVRHSDSRRFEKTGRGRNTDDQYRKQFETLNWKLDKILKILTPAVPIESAKDPKPKKSTNDNKKKKTSAEKEIPV